MKHSDACNHLKKKKKTLQQLVDPPGRSSCFSACHNKKQKHAFIVIVNAGKLILLSNRHDYWVHNDASFASLIRVASVFPHSQCSESNIFSHGTFFDHHDVFAVALLPTLNECPLHASVICISTGKFHTLNLRHASPELLSTNRNSLETEKKTSRNRNLLIEIFLSRLSEEILFTLQGLCLLLYQNSSYSP